MPRCRLEHLPEGLRAGQSLELRHSRLLRSLPDLESLRVDLGGCTGLDYLPGELRAGELILAGCTGLKWQDWAEVEVDRLDISDCPQIQALPDWLGVSDSINVANTGLKGLPTHLRSCRIQWRGVEVDERIAFHPESIEPDEVLREQNSERRRVILERVGWERFFARVRPKVVHRDRDPGGERMLMEFEFENEREAARVLAVQCPSSSRKYFIRVPPGTSTCHAAAAWIAGFENADEYEPMVET